MSTPNLKNWYTVSAMLYIAKQRYKIKRFVKHTCYIDYFTVSKIRNDIKKSAKSSQILPYIFKQINMQDTHLVKCEFNSLVIVRRFGSCR